jgi:hypothetical protein
MRISAQTTSDAAERVRIEATLAFTERDIGRRFPRAPEVVKRSLCYRIAAR